jgi:glycosyltransferase involved in cell wall biosynthesis
VVASTAGALPEVLGDAALLVDSCDEEALAEAIRAAAQDTGDLRRRGLARAARFTWQRAAEETWRVYEEAARLA